MIITVLIMPQRCWLRLNKSANTDNRYASASYQHRDLHSRYQARRII